MCFAENAALVLAGAIGLCVLLYPVVVAIGITAHLAFATLSWLERKWELRR